MSEPVSLPFAKMEGTGNDYVYVDAIRDPLPLERAPVLARLWSDRHFGIGADGLIALVRTAAAPLAMQMWNADGSRGAMCGNGLRCLAQFAVTQGHAPGHAFGILTDAGPRTVELLRDERTERGGGFARAGLGEVRCSEPVTVTVAGREVTLIPGDAGNPHAVCFVDDVERCDVLGIGAALQRQARFPDGVNVEFVAITGPASLRQRTFERGSGETLACGTGAAVAALAARRRGLIRGEIVDVELRGGVLRVVPEGSSLAIEGPVRTVFTGRIELPV